MFDMVFEPRKNREIERKFTPSITMFLFRLNRHLDLVKAAYDRYLENGDEAGYTKKYYKPFMRGISLNNIEIMTLALEDRRFLRHNGFDIISIPRIIKRRLYYGRWGGMSTIEQQFVRTVLRARARTVSRKSHEVILACLLQYHLNKMQILGAYLSCVYVGSCGRGVDSASRLIFERDAVDLNLEEAAFVASLLVYPLPRSVRDVSEKLHLYPVVDLSRYFTILRNEGFVSWANKIERRIKYANNYLEKLNKRRSRYTMERSSRSDL